MPDGEVLDRSRKRAICAIALDFNIADVHVVRVLRRKLKFHIASSQPADRLGREMERAGRLRSF